MRDDWNSKPLGDLLELVIDHRGKTPNKMGFDDFHASGYPVLSAKHVKTDELVNIDSIRFANTEMYKKWMKVEVQKGDIVLTSEAPMGEVYYLDGKVKYLLGQRVFGLRPKKELIDPLYLSAWLTSSNCQNQLAARASGTTALGIKQSELLKIIVDIPPDDVQKKIGELRYNFSKKIALNTQTNQTLEAIAQAIFKSWFVDFDPVKAKARLKYKLETESGDWDAGLTEIAEELGLSKDVLALFPYEFEESELGLIPKGWENKPFGELLTNSIGGDWGKELPDNKHTEEVKILRGTDLPKVYRGDDSGVPVRYVEAKKLKTRVIEDGDIVIEISGGSKDQPTGRSLYFTQKLIDRLGYKLEPASFCRLFKPINKKIGMYLSLHLMKIYDDGKTWQYQNQSTGISNFQTTMFLEKEIVVVPDNKVIDAFYRLVLPMILKIHSNQNQTLTKLRDTVLPKLLSGEITIESATDLVKSAA